MKPCGPGARRRGCCATSSLMASDAVRLRAEVLMVLCGWASFYSLVSHASQRSPVDPFYKMVHSIQWC